MKKIAFLMGGILIFALAGCRSEPPLSGVPQPKQGPVEFVINTVNNTLGSVNDAYLAATETLEYTGNKFDDSTDLMGEVAQSL